MMHVSQASTAVAAVSQPLRSAPPRLAVASQPADDFFVLSGPPREALIEPALEVGASNGIRSAEVSGGLTSQDVSQTIATLESLVPTSKMIWLNVMLIVGTIGTWRGFGMLLKGIRKYIDDSKAFYLNQDLNHSPINLHTIEQKGDKIILNICTVNNETLAGVLDNSSAVRLMKSAAKKCTADQPLPSLEFGKVSDFFGKLCLKGLQPNPDRLLQEFNKRVVDHYSTITTAAHIAKSLGEPTTSDVQYLVPICEVSKRKERWLWFMKWGTHERNIVFAAVPSEVFRKFADTEFVANLKGDNPRLVSRIDQLEKAWKARATYAENQGKISGEDFFPDVTVSKVSGRSWANADGVKDSKNIAA